MAKPDLQLLGMMSEHHAKSEVMDSRVSKLEKKLESAFTDFDSKLSGIAPIVMGLIKAEIDAQVKVAVESYKDQILQLVTQLIAQHETGEEEVTKHGTVETPDGIHKMTVIETRRRKRTMNG